MTETDLEQMKIWIKALRSGEYSQTKTTLEDCDGYCCLGVAVKVLVDDPVMRIDGTLFGEFPEHQRNAPAWLIHANNDFQSKAGFYLANLNDMHNFTFFEIADLLEMVYINGEVDKAKEILRNRVRI